MFGDGAINKKLAGEMGRGEGAGAGGKRAIFQLSPRSGRTSAKDGRSGRCPETAWGRCRERTSFPGHSDSEPKMGGFESENNRRFGPRQTARMWPNPACLPIGSLHGSFAVHVGNLVPLCVPRKMGSGRDDKHGLGSDPAQSIGRRWQLEHQVSDRARRRWVAWVLNTVT